MKAVALLLALACVVAAAGCGGQESAETAKDHLCSSLHDLGSSVSDLQKLDPTTASKDDYKAASQEVQDALEQVQSDAKDVKDATTRELQQATNQLTQQLKSIPTDVPLTQVASSLAGAVSAFAGSFATTLNAEGCNKD